MTSSWAKINYEVVYKHYTEYYRKGMYVVLLYIMYTWI